MSDQVNTEWVMPALAMAVGRRQAAAAGSITAIAAAKMPVMPTAISSAVMG
jgi:hypothetical protein